MTEEQLLAAWRAEIAAGVEAKRLTRVGAQVTLIIERGPDSLKVQRPLDVQPAPARTTCSSREKFLGSFSILVACIGPALYVGRGFVGDGSHVRRVARSHDGKRSYRHPPAHMRSPALNRPTDSLTVRAAGRLSVGRAGNTRRIRRLWRCRGLALA